MLKLNSINIQGDMNHETVLPFLIKENADVVCFQEIFEQDLEIYEKALGVKSFFKPMHTRQSFKNQNQERGFFGPAIFTKHEVKFSYKYVYGDESQIPKYSGKVESENDRYITSNIVLIWADIVTPDGDKYKISTTHFTWTPDGSSTWYQIKDMKKMISILEGELKEFILVGDLNTPRGFESFKMLADKYTDNIPAEYDSSLDPVLHRVPGLKRMVDCLFSTENYKVSDVKFVEGVSDHKAVVAVVEKVQ